jgi:hypothetical protein
MQMDALRGAGDELGSLAEQVGAAQATVDPAAGSALPGAVGREQTEGAQPGHGATDPDVPLSETMGAAVPIRLIVAAITVLAVLIAAFLL